MFVGTYTSIRHDIPRAAVMIVVALPSKLRVIIIIIFDIMPYRHDVGWLRRGG